MVGIRDVDTSRDYVNPKDDHQVTEDHGIIYLAKSELLAPLH